MTSLALQLNRLALPPSDPNVLNRQEVASLLFTSKEAASIDRRTFYALGCNGLEELIGIEPAFEEFQDTLFSLASLGLERGVQSKDINQKLNRDIDLFLIRLSPFILLKPALKCLEWLIHRFHIHTYNEESLVGCVLPYYETKVFTRVIQLLNIKEPTNNWNWLHRLQIPGVPLARGVLLIRCCKDLGFMEFVCDLVTKAIMAYSNSIRCGSTAQLRVLFSFYASTIVSALDVAENITDPMMAKLLPHVQLGLKSSIVDHKAATYMIVSHLATKVVMENTLVDSLATQIGKSLCGAPVLTTKAGLCCLNILFQNQTDGGVGLKAYQHLCRVPDLVPALQSIGSCYNINNVLQYIVPHLIHSVVTDEGDEILKISTCSRNNILQSILQDIPLTNGLDVTAVKLTLEIYISHGFHLHSSGISALNQRVQPVVRLFETKYPEAFDTVMEGYVMDSTSLSETWSLYHQFTSMTVSSYKYEILADSNMSILHSLRHKQPAIRGLAVRYLKELLQNKKHKSLGKNFLKEALLARLEDDVPEVATSALQAMELFVDELDPTDMLSSLLSVLKRVNALSPTEWSSTVKQVLSILEKFNLLDQSPELQACMFRDLLPFLVFTNALRDSPELHLTTFVAQSTLISQIPLVKGWTNVLKDVLMTTQDLDLVGVANQHLTLTLTRNLSLMDAASKRTAMEDVVKALEKPLHPKTSIRDEAVFVVLSHTLLEGLTDLSETQHLLIAQRFYNLLEPTLLKLIAQPHHINVGPCPPVFVWRNLDKYLSKLHRDQEGEMEQTQLLVSLLWQFICNLKSPQSGFKGETWWNPERLDTSTCCYLRLLCRLFDLVIKGASHERLAPAFRPLLSLFFQKHFSDSLEVFKFLSLLWGYFCNLGDQLECTVSVICQTQALYVGKALLAIESQAGLNLLTSNFAPVIPTLLVCLSSPVREVRRAALACLQILQVVTSSFSTLIHALCERADELIADQNFLNQALGRMYDDALSAQPKKIVELDAIESLLRSIQTPSCPAYLSKALLRTLRKVNGKRVLPIIVPILDQLLDQCCSELFAFEGDEGLLILLLLEKFDEESASVLATEPESLEVFLRAMRIESLPQPTLPSIQVTALGKITKGFFSAVNEEAQQRILAVIFDLLVDCHNQSCAQAVSNIFKQIALDSELLAKELTPSKKTNITGYVTQSFRSSRLRNDATAVCDEVMSIHWKRVSLILEHLQHKKKIKRPQILVPVLFHLLARILELELPDFDNIEHTKQLILGCLLNICQKISPDSRPLDQDVLEEDQMNVELVVQCLRTSSVPQTHFHALLLLTAIAGIFPEKVLHNIMPIFTFMGASVLRLEDAYSFEVIDKTMQTVIPALIKADKEGSVPYEANLGCVVTKIVYVFMDALPYMPEHRRLPILCHLLTTLGPADFLWVVLLLLLKQHATHESGDTRPAKEKNAILKNNMAFWISVCCKFEIKDQLSSLIKIFKFLSTLPEDKDDDSKKRGTPHNKKEDNTDELILNLDLNDSKMLRHFLFACVSFMSQLLGSQSFLEKVADQEDTQDELVHILQQSLLEEILFYVQVVAQFVEDKCNSPSSKFWRELLNKSYEILGKVNSLLPTNRFIKVIIRLVGNPLSSAKKKAIDLLNNRLQQKRHWHEEEVTALLPLIKDLCAVFDQGGRPQPINTEQQPKESAIYQQKALYSLKLMCHNFGASYPELFLPVLNTTVDMLVSSSSKEKNVTASVLLCIAEVTSNIKALAIPQLHRVMPAVLNTLVEHKDHLTNEVYLLSAITALKSVVETLPHFISPYLLDTLQQVTHLSRLTDQFETRYPQLLLKLSSLRKTLASCLPTRVLLPSVTNCYQKLVESKQDCLPPLMLILKEHISQLEKEEINCQQAELTSFFMLALDFRGQHCQQGELNKTNEIEGSIIDALLCMIMKLSEVTFRTLYFKLFDWCMTDNGGNISDRQLTFYRISDVIAEKLKGLFVLFAGHLVKPFSDLLKQIHSTYLDDSLSQNEHDGTEKRCQLLQYVLDCLQKIFLYDTKKFLTKERAKTLLNPLVDQFENLTGGENRYQTRVIKHLIPCIGQFAVSMGEDSQWKLLNQQVLLKMRHSSAKVRFSSLLMILELTSRLKENYVMLLPETIPFLAELMEDDCEEVEKQVQIVIAEMETILGEPLQSYF